jgi:MFS family permease
LTHTFRAFNSFNYRMWASGAIVSNVGTWMQRTAQDWLVLTQLTNRNATAVGVVMALQFAPLLLLLPWTGFAADHFNRRKLLIFTQASLGALALGLGILTVTGFVQLWHVYIFAFLLGCVTAFDTPARQSFVSELVAETHLPNAVALNSASFNVARMIGPAIAGALIAYIGCGWLFIMNAASYVGVILSLTFLRVSELHTSIRAEPGSQKLLDGFRYVWQRPEMTAILSMLFLIGTFGINFPIYISTMAVTAFHVGSAQFGLLTSMMAIGSVSGALLSARRISPRMTVLAAAAVIFGIGFIVGAVMPNYWLFGLALIIIGGASQSFTTTANARIQLSTEPLMRGRVMALFFAIAMGGTPLGAPIVGWVADRFGPRWALVVGGASGFAAGLVALVYFWRFRHRVQSMQAAKIRIDR